MRLYKTNRHVQYNTQRTIVRRYPSMYYPFVRRYTVVQKKERCVVYGGLEVSGD